MISILLPTRNRGALLARGLRSLRDLAAYPESVEYLIRADNDDLTDIEAIAPYAQVIRGPRLGYDGLHVGMNELAERAAGDWLLLWNDDAYMKTGRWDALLAEAPSTVIQFLRKDDEREADCTMPAVSQGIYRAIGHISLHCFYDGWLYDSALAADCGAVRKRGEIIFHHDFTRDRLRGGDGRLYGQMFVEREVDAKAIRTYILGDA